MQKILIRGNFEKGLLANSQYCLMLNETNCKPKKWQKSNKKLKPFNFLETEKINTTYINVGVKRKLEEYKLECEEHGHNVRNTVKRPILDF